MSNWKQSLDRYLTSEPEDNFTPFCEQVDEAFSDEFYEKNESWISFQDGLCNKWLNKLYKTGDGDAEKAARIIERAYKLYIA